MTIHEQTHELGKQIKASKQMEELMACEKAQMEDENAKKLLQEFNLNRMNLGRDMQEGKISQEEAIKKNQEAFDKMLNESEVIRAFVEAKNNFDALVNEINGILNFYITGQDPNGCTHNCSTCGGCH